MSVFVITRPDGSIYKTGGSLSCNYGDEYYNGAGWYKISAGDEPIHKYYVELFEHYDHCGHSLVLMQQQFGSNPILKSNISDKEFKTIEEAEENLKEEIRLVRKQYIIYSEDQKIIYTGKPLTPLMPEFKKEIQEKYVGWGTIRDWFPSKDREFFIIAGNEFPFVWGKIGGPYNHVIGEASGIEVLKNKEEVERRLKLKSFE